MAQKKPFGNVVILLRKQRRTCASSTAIRWLIIIIGLIFAFAMVSLVACSYYTAFSVRAEEVDFTFEYPREWSMTDVEKYPEGVHVNVLATWTPSEDKSSVAVFLNVYLGLGSKAEQEAQSMLTSKMSFYENQRNYKLVRYETTRLDGVDGYLLEYTYDHLARDVPVTEERTYIATRSLDITIPRNGRVYQITVGGSQAEWDRHQKELEHLLDTFRWK